MANWCSNFILTGNQDVKDVFQKLIKRQEKSGQGETLDWFEDDRYLFDIEIYGDSIMFQTKWGPALKTAEALAKTLKTEIELDYDEPSNLVYGKAIFNPKGEIKDYYLSDLDFDKYEYNEEKDIYIFEGQEYESDEDIKEILLKRKMND